MLENVKVEENRVRISVNPLFYDINSIEIVKKEFGQISKIFQIKSNPITVLELQPKQKLKPEELEILGYEFYNHLLNAVKETRSE